MAFDINKHILVPKHSKLSDKEKEILFSQYRVTIKELPKIISDDPAISKLNVRLGDIIKIERNSRTAGTTVYYRVVVEN